MSAARPVEQILDLARWAPSGDNTQPWRFEIRADDHVVVHAFDTREHCVYDLDGHASQIAMGALLETLRIAASSRGLLAQVARVTGSSETRPRFDVRLHPDTGAPSELVPCITTRSVQRRPLSSRRLTEDEKQKLEASVAPDFELMWLESNGMKRAIARLMFANGKLRLTMREAYEVHRSIIEWNAQFSATKVPDQAVGLGRIMSYLMRWALEDWRRVNFLNTFLAGTWLPRLQLDVIPALACAAHVVILARAPAQTIDDYVAAGAAIQRFWLTAEKLGLRHQPEITPLIFGRYAREGRRFSRQGEMSRLAGALAERIDAMLGAAAARRAVWMGRIGEGPASRARSLRLPLADLVVESRRD